MVASGLPRASSGFAPSDVLSKASSRGQSLQRTPSRRVYFSEGPSKNQDKKQWESGEDQKERRGCGLCCAWASLIVGSVILVLVLIGALLLSLLQGALPEFRIKSLSITRLELSGKDQDTKLSADVELLINATNKNDKFDLSYGSLKVDVSSEDIDLGNTSVSPFKQDSRKASVLKLNTRVKKADVNSVDAETLKSNYKTRQVVIDVVFRGSIGINFNGHEIDNLPLTVLCSDIDQSVIDNGLQPQCHVKMFSFI